MRRAPAVCLVVAGLVCAALTMPQEAESSPSRALPRSGKVVSEPPLLRWPRVESARLYNVQVVRNGRKILSRWPSRTRLELHKKWRYRGRTVRLRPAVYSWYVYPWFGSRYGSARVRNTFIRGTIPAVLVRPALGGEAREDAVLVASSGRWRGTRPIRFSYRWRRCDAAGRNCAEIEGALKNSYTPVPADIGKTIRGVVTATNLARSRSAASVPSSVVLPAPPRNASRPDIWGPLQQGATVTAASGAWMSSAPLSYTFKWQRCTIGGPPCRTIQDATQQGYRLKGGDFEHRLRVVITARNAGGAHSAVSTLSAAVGRAFAGTSGDDLILGSRGADRVRAGAGADIVRTGAGDDRLRGGSGADRLVGGRGRDTIVANGGSGDVVRCGSGRDRAIVDRSDRVSRCETVIRR